MQPNATNNVTFLVTLNSGGPGAPALAGKNIVLSYDVIGGSSVIGTTDANGQVTFTQAYAVAGNFSVVATFAGEVSRVL